MKKQIFAVIVTMFGLASCSPKPIHLPIVNTSPTHFFLTPTSNPSTPTNDFQTNNEDVLLDFALSQDETKVAIYSNQEVFIYNFVTHKKSSIKSFENKAPADNHSGRIAFSPDGTQIAISNIFKNESIEVWSLESSSLVASFSDITKGYQIKQIAFTPNGKNILARISESACEKTKEKFILFSINGESNWTKSDIVSLELDHYCEIYPYYPNIIFRFTSNGELFIFQFIPHNAPVLIFDANTGRYISKLSVGNKEQARIYYDVSHDGKTVVANAADRSYLVNIETGKETGFQGQVFLLNNENRFLVNNVNPAYLYLSEDGKAKCSYAGIYYGTLTDRVRISAAKNIFGSYNFEQHEFQVWKISNCELMYALPIDW